MAGGFRLGGEYKCEMNRDNGFCCVVVRRLNDNGFVLDQPFWTKRRGYSETSRSRSFNGDVLISSSMGNAELSGRGGSELSRNRLELDDGSIRTQTHDPFKQLHIYRNITNNK
jgi:hypothetical protein